MKDTRKVFAVVLVIFLALIFFILFGLDPILNAFATETPIPTNTPILPTSTALPVVTLWCQDCADEGMNINIWTLPNRSGIAGSVPHNTNAELIKTEVYDGIKYYKIHVVGMNITGYVSELMIKNP